MRCGLRDTCVLPSALPCVYTCRVCVHMYMYVDVYHDHGGGSRLPGLMYICYKLHIATRLLTTTRY